MHQLFLRKDPWTRWLRGLPRDWLEEEFQALFMHRFPPQGVNMEENHMVIPPAVSHTEFNPYTRGILARPLRDCPLPTLPIYMQKCLCWQSGMRPRAADFALAAPSNAAPAVAPDPA